MKLEITISVAPVTTISIANPNGVDQVTTIHIVAMPTLEPTSEPPNTRRRNLDHWCDLTDPRD